MLETLAAEQASMQRSAFGMNLTATQLRASTRAHWAAARMDLALNDAMLAYAKAPNDRRVKGLVTRLLHAEPGAATHAHGPALRRLVDDPQIDPTFVEPPGWRYLLQCSELFGADAMADPALMALRLENDAFARSLLASAVVTHGEVERRLSVLRRWFLLSDRWREFSLGVDALRAQASLNGGAWLIDPEERRQLETRRASAIAGAYWPPRPERSSPAPFADPVTKAVASQYEGWPFPPWIRAMASARTTLAEAVRKIDPAGPETIPSIARVLVAGCGTGREAAMYALRFPRDEITAIDVSGASLRYAADRCRDGRLAEIEFIQLDLHQVGDLGREFDGVFACGVLHHLPDPEAGWAALTAVLKPGGVMRIMLYSRVARLSVTALRRSIADLRGEPLDDDLLRDVRRRVLETAPFVPRSKSFYSLSGIHGLLLCHEDPFDVPRIHRAMDVLGLDLLNFQLPDSPAAARYHAEYPHDPLCRDFSAWAETELHDPGLFAGMYDFWCRKRPA